MSPHEMAALQIVMENQLSAQDTMAASDIQNQMVNAGFSRLAGTLSLRLLENRGYMESTEDQDINGNSWWSYRVTSTGVDWLLSNQDLFQLRQRSDPAKKVQPPKLENDSFGQGITDDDVPF